MYSILRCIRSFLITSEFRRIVGQQSADPVLYFGELSRLQFVHRVVQLLELGRDAQRPQLVVRSFAPTDWHKAVPVPVEHQHIRCAESTFRLPLGEGAVHRRSLVEKRRAGENAADLWMETQPGVQ